LTELICHELRQAGI